jgi:hypothetical protein
VTSFGKTDNFNFCLYADVLYLSVLSLVNIVMLNNG